jgi:hypothetical protein
VPAASNYTSGGATNTVNDDLAQFGPVEQAIVQYFKANPSGPDGHHVRQILEGTKRIAPQSLGVEKNEQLQVIAYASFFSCRVDGGKCEADVSDRNAINTLTEQGILFSTLDEQHYALC